ncbi:tripartite ATP-independent transporter DctP family solute receptor [Catalinimonas alkaloidigena]|uniref:TRAP transporter substrate-binding protein n=1 Tax=Catalinimonas alkaloidigena TaxID=1075417 RepID=UPI002406F9F1|nr:TRAP transporter substrate-binding protein [Catalinimonas alkaloidigena]MDF9797231.1 tripartite ATP-independent transporter DctP family solute receptor [Catalinimonas alkaloidigena]
MTKLNFSSYKILLLLLVLSIFTSCNRIGGVRTLKIAHSNDASHPVHHGMLYLAEKVEEKSGGKLLVNVYPSAQLGQERECIELLQIGSLAMTKSSAAVMEGFAPNFKVLSLPYIFRDKEHQFNVLDGDVGKELMLEGEKYWLRGVTFYDAGSRSFYTKDAPVEEPADLIGKKIRVMPSNTAINMVQELGGSPTPISYGELYTALQQGVVDAAENNPPSFFFSRHYEVCKYYSLNEHTSIPDILLISTIVWNTLNEQEQQWLQEAAEESAVYQRELWAKSEKESIEAVKAAGVTVTYPDKSKFAEKVKPLYETYKDQPEVYDFIQRIQAVN